MDLAQRIENFKNMAEADPTNELSHFSLGKAYLEAGQPEQAACALQRVIELNKTYSKAYQLLGESYDAMGQKDKAVDTWQKGYVVAHGRGDIMPRDAMAASLSRVGASVPDVGDQVRSSAPATSTGKDQVQCNRCGQVAPQMAERPFKGALGEKIHQNICAHCWQEWIGMGTKVINELRLDFANPQASAMYDQHMLEFLQLQDDQ